VTWTLEHFAPGGGHLLIQGWEGDDANGPFLAKVEASLANISCLAMTRCTIDFGEAMVPDSLDGIDGFWQIEAGKDTNKMNISGGKGKKTNRLNYSTLFSNSRKSEQFQCTLWYVIVRFQYSQ
jgi:hypothetical protein